MHYISNGSEMEGTPHIKLEVSICQCIKVDLDNRLIFNGKISGDLYRLSSVCLTFNVCLCAHGPCCSACSVFECYNTRKNVIGQLIVFTSHRLIAGIHRVNHAACKSHNHKDSSL